MASQEPQWMSDPGVRIQEALPILESEIAETEQQERERRRLLALAADELAKLLREGRTLRY